MWKASPPAARLLTTALTARLIAWGDSLLESWGIHLEYAGGNRIAVYPLSLSLGGRSSGRGRCKLSMEPPVVLEVSDVDAVVSGQPATSSDGMWLRVDSSSDAS